MGAALGSSVYGYSPSAAVGWHYERLVLLCCFVSASHTYSPYTCFFQQWASRVCGIALRGEGPGTMP